jgi:hypothetical protein
MTDPRPASSTPPIRISLHSCNNIDPFIDILTCILYLMFKIK